MYQYPSTPFREILLNLLPMSNNSLNDGNSNLLLPLGRFTCEGTPYGEPARYPVPSTPFREIPNTDADISDIAPNALTPSTPFREIHEENLYYVLANMAFAIATFYSL